MAATAAISGFSGSITGPTGFTEVTQWKLTVTQDKLDATLMNGAENLGYKQFIGGLSGAEGTATTQGTVIPARGTLAACTLKTKSTGGATIAGSIIVDKVDVNVPVDGKVTYDISFAFSSSISIT